MPVSPAQALLAKDAWDIAAHVGQVLGLCTAGIWAYFNFVKSRTYLPRMELSASGAIHKTRKGRVLVPRVILQNIGRSRVELLQERSGYKVWYSKGAPKVGGRVVWDGGLPVYRIFPQHRWIEPGESIFHETSMHLVPDDAIAAKIEVQLRAPIGTIRPRVTVFSSFCVVVVTTEGEKP